MTEIVVSKRDINSHMNSRKTSKISRNDFKHHKKMSPSTKSSTSLLSQYYQEKSNNLKVKTGEYQLELNLRKCTLVSQKLQEMDSKDTTFLQYISWTTDGIGVI